MIKHFEVITNTRGDSLPNYRVQVVDSAGATVTIYADSSGTRFTDSSGNIINYATADSRTGKVEFYWTPATGQVLQALDLNGELVDATADFADKYVLANLPGEIAQSAVTNLTTDLAAKTATADLASTATGKGDELVAAKWPGTGALARNVDAKLRDIPSPFDFDITEGNDSTAGFGQWLTACRDEGIAPHSTRKLIVPISDTIEMPVPALSADFTGLFLSNITLLYAGTRDRPAFKINGASGGGNVLNTGPELWLPRVVADGAAQWPGTLTGEDIGILLEYVFHSRIYVPWCEKFTKGYELRNCSYNEVHVAHLTDNKYAEVLSTKGALTTFQFTNENTFIGGKRGCSSAVNLLGDAYGTALTWDGVSSYQGHNDNHWFRPCYELGVPAGATYRVPILLNGAGSYCRWHDIRVETCKGPTAIFDGGGTNRAHSCIVDVAFNSTGFAEQIDHLLQVNDAAGNIYKGERAKELRWRSGDLSKLLSSAGGANSPYLRGDVFLMDTGSGTPIRSTSIVTRVTTNAKALQLNGAGVFVAVDTSKVKTFRAVASSLPGFSGRPTVVAFDSAGNRLTGDATDATWGNEPYVKRPGGEIVAAAAYGGSYQGASADGTVDWTFTVRDEVEKIYVGWASGSANLAIRSFEIIGYGEPEDAAGNAAQDGLRVFADLLDDGSTRLASAKPDTAGTHGYYAKGQKVYSSAVAATATDGWPCSTAGWLAPAWAASTAYSVPGHVVINGGNAYELVTAGTSAGSGGPTGTGTGIVDGTCVWNYVGVKAAFVTAAVTS